MSSAPADPEPPRRQSSGSNKRQRGRVVSVRLTADEDAALLAKAQAAGLSLGSYMRMCALGGAGPRARRSVSVDAQLLATAVAQLNKAGSNLNQVARALNFGQPAYQAFSIEALAEVRQAVAQIRAAVGRTDKTPGPAAEPGRPRSSSQSGSQARPHFQTRDTPTRDAA
jgi:hypothetical protein